MCLMLNVTDHRLYYKVKPYHTPGFPHQHSFKINSTQKHKVSFLQRYKLSGEICWILTSSWMSSSWLSCQPQHKQCGRERKQERKKKKKGKKKPHVACDNLVQAMLLLHNTVIFREGEIGGWSSSVCALSHRHAAAPEHLLKISLRRKERRKKSDTS